jgi:hypothetical protein
MSQARDLAEIASGNTVASATPSGGLVHIETKTVAEASSSTTAFDFTDVFSATYNRYFIDYDIVRDGDGSHTALFASLSNANTRLTNQTYGSGDFYQTGASYSGQIYFSSNDGIHQLGADLGATGNGYFRGNGYIIDPFSTTKSTQIMVEHTMSQQLTTPDEDGFYQENTTSIEQQSSPSKATDILFGIIVGNSGGANVAFSASQASVFGSVAIYGIKDSV